MSGPRHPGWIASARTQHASRVVLSLCCRIQRVHPRRAARGDRHHRDTCCHSASRASESTLSDTARVQCASNMHQWAIALQGYAAGNKGSFPSNLDGADISWIGATVQQFATEYIGQNLNGLITDKIPNGGGDHVMYCPTQEWHRYVRDNWPSAPGLLPTNSPLYNNAAPGAMELVGYFYMPYRQTDPAAPNSYDNYTPAGNAWVAKKRFFNNDASNAPILTDMIQSSNGTWGGPVPYSSHIERSGNVPEGGNFMFEDGHVEWHGLGELSIGMTMPGWEFHYKLNLPP